MTWPNLLPEGTARNYWSSRKHLLWIRPIRFPLRSCICGLWCSDESDNGCSTLNDGSREKVEQYEWTDWNLKEFLTIWPSTECDLVNCSKSSRAPNTPHLCHPHSFPCPSLPHSLTSQLSPVFSPSLGLTCRSHRPLYYAAVLNVQIQMAVCLKSLIIPLIIPHWTKQTICLSWTGSLPVMRSLTICKLPGSLLNAIMTKSQWNLYILTDHMTCSTPLQWPCHLHNNAWHTPTPSAQLPVYHHNDSTTTYYNLMTLGNGHNIEMTMFGQQ